VVEACITHLRDEKCIQYFKLENLKGEDHLEDLGIDGRINWILGK
jgi:hypothetical protein